MHMTDALLSPAVGITFWSGSMGVMAYSTKKIKDNLDDKSIPLMGVLGAFIFAVQMVNFTIPGTGSSGHLGGGLLLAIILGPHAAFIVMASVLMIQSLLFADGGLLALGCNTWNLGIYASFLAYPLVYRPIMKKGGSRKRMVMATVLGTVTALQLGALSVVLETLISGKSELPFGIFVSMMLPIHLVIGLVEGFITAGVISYIKRIRPEILEDISLSSPFTPAASHVSMKKVLLSLLTLTMITGGIISWFASSNPDGLEWSIEKIYGNTELPARETGLASDLKKIQGKTALLPDYNFKTANRASEMEQAKKADNSWPDIQPGTSLSGIIGAVMVLGLTFSLGLGIKAIKKKRP